MSDKRDVGLELQAGLEERGSLAYRDKAMDGDGQPRRHPLSFLRWSWEPDLRVGAKRYRLSAGLSSAGLCLDVSFPFAGGAG